MKIVDVSQGSGYYQRLQDFAQQHQLLFHQQAWLSIYDPTQLVQCAILNRNDELIGCFLYYKFRKFGYQCLISPPFTPDISLFFIDPSGSVVGSHSFQKELFAEIAAYFDALKVSYIHLNLPANVTDTQPFIWAGYLSRNRYSYLLDLGLSEEQLRDNLATEKRKSLNKALKDGLEIRSTNDADVICSLVGQSLDRNGQHSHRELLHKIIRTFSGSPQAIAFAAFANGTPIGVAFCLVTQHKALYLFGGFDDSSRHHGAGVSCMWQCILEARQRGLACFDFEGSMRPAIERYFREFGGRLTTYFNVEKSSISMKILLALKRHKPI